MSDLDKTLEQLFETKHEEQERAIGTVLARAQEELVDIEIKRMELQQFVSLLGAARLRIHEESASS